jgi:hypothetical protein
MNMREASTWTKATRKNGGGIHLYVPMEIVERALADGNIAIKNEELEVCFTSLRDKTNGRGSIHIRIRERKECRN